MIITLATICKEINVNPRDARRKLRNAKNLPDTISDQWAWALKDAPAIKAFLSSGSTVPTREETRSTMTPKNVQAIITRNIELSPVAAIQGRRELEMFFKKIGKQLAYLADRWKDESEYEDFEEYKTRMKAMCEDKIVWVSSSKRPFGMYVRHTFLPGKQFFIGATSRKVYVNEV